MRRRNVHGIHEIHIHIRLVVPCVDHDGTELRHRDLECGFIHHFSPGRIYEDRARLHQGEESLVSHIPRSLVQRHMHGHHLRVLKQVFQRAEALRSLSLGTRRIISEHIETQVSGHLLNLLSHISDADDSDRTAVDLDSLARSHAIKGREHILHDTPDVASGRILHLDSMTVAVTEVHMVCSYRRSGDQLHRRTFQKVGIAPCPRTQYQCIRIPDIIGSDFRSLLVHHLPIRFENPFEERHIHICNYLHIYVFISIQVS